MNDKKLKMVTVKVWWEFIIKNNAVDKFGCFCDIYSLRIITEIMTDNILSGYIIDNEGIDKFLGTS